MTTLSSGYCPICGKQTDTTSNYCEHCAGDLRQFRQRPQPIIQAEQQITDAPNNNDEPAEAKSLKKRYWDAYTVARTTVGIGTTIKTVGAILGFLIFFGVLLIANNQRGYASRNDAQLFGLIFGAIWGGLVFLVFFIWGVLVSAQGQILKASLDGAVNSSPFLTNEQRARIMSL
jgi:hypothetical protein